MDRGGRVSLRVGPTLDVHLAVTVDEFGRQQHGLLGVVGDSAGRHSFGDGVVGRRRLEVDQDLPEDAHDFVSRHHLRRHAQRVTDRQTIKCARGTVQLRQGFHPSSLRKGAPYYEPLTARRPKSQLP
jgi:hypothetical protein